MATYHCSIKHGKSGTARAHSEYIRREGKYAKGEKKEELQYTEYGNLPDWAKDPNDFFDKADLYERSNGSPYSEFEVALPNELTLEENIRLVRDFVKEQIGDNKVYSFAIHDKDASLDSSQRQPHAHIMFCERIITDKERMKPKELFFRRYNSKHPDRGGYRKDNSIKGRNGEGREKIKDIRASWAAKINAAYETRGINLKVSEKTLKAQREEALAKGNEIKAEELNRPAQCHLGPKEANKLKRAKASEDYRFDKLGDKARMTLIACEIKKIAEEIAKNTEAAKEAYEIAKNSRASLQEEKKRSEEDFFDIDGKKLSITIGYICRSLSYRVQENENRIATLNKRIVSEDKMSEIAEAIVSRGENKRLRREEVALVQDWKQLEQDWQKFQKLPEPRFYQLTYKKDFYQQREGYILRKKELQERSATLKQKQEALKKNLNTPDNQKHMETIKTILRTKNFVREQHIARLRKVNDNFESIRSRCSRVANSVRFKYTYRIEKSAYEKLKRVNLKTLPDTMSRIAESVKQLDEERVRGGIKINLRDRERDDGYER